jgi:deferrochelatase/peroxidase EfeB
VDFDANMKASMKVAGLLSPYLRTVDPDLVSLIRQRNDAVQRPGPRGRRRAGPAADPSAPPTDTGEATGLPAARLTITIGYGPSLFDGRLGLSSRKPAALRPLPVLANEDLDPGRSGGDLCLQACSDDPQVAFHAVRNLARGYSFTDGIVPETGTLDGGLFFIAYMRDPAQFVRLQQSLTGDALNEYIRHVSSAVFVCPPGLRPGQDWGGVLFG